MSRDRLDLMSRLLRLRQLDEDREAAQLRGEVSSHVAAVRRTEEANDAVERIGQGKVRSDLQRGLDLDAYEASLHFEQRAMEAADAASRDQRQAHESLQRATDRHGAAAAAARVSEARRGWLSEQARRDEEMRDSDRQADLRQALNRSDP